IELADAIQRERDFADVGSSGHCEILRQSGPRSSNPVPCRSLARMQTFNDRARLLDDEDALRTFRDEFFLVPGTIYMDGNSLGLLSKPAERTLREMLQAWKTLGIDGWLGGAHPWYHLSEELGALAAPLIGAHAH